MGFRRHFYECIFSLLLRFRTLKELPSFVGNDFFFNSTVSEIIRKILSPYLKAWQDSKS